MLNKVFLIGRIGQEPELKRTNLGINFLNVAIATTEKFKDKQGNKQEKTEWHKLNLWNNQADFVAKYLKKGSLVHVEGSLQTREWTDKDGNKRYTTEIKVKDIKSLEKIEKQNNQGCSQDYNQQNNQGYNKRQNYNQQSGFIPDDTPF